jgi:hypothetical protein
LAICEEERGNDVLSWRLHRELDSKLPKNDPRRAISKDRFSRLDQQLAKLELVRDAEAPLDCTAEDVSDERVLEFGTESAFVPGQRVIAVSASGFRPQRYTLELVAGERRSLSVRPGRPVRVERREGRSSGEPTSTANLAPTADGREVPGGLTPAAGSSAKGLWGTVLVGVSAVALTGSGVLGLVMLQQQDIVDSDCTAARDGGRVCGDRGLEAGRRGQFYSDLGTASFVLGALSGAAGAYLLLTDDVRVSANADEASASVTVRTRF